MNRRSFIAGLLASAAAPLAPAKCPPNWGAYALTSIANYDLRGTSFASFADFDLSRDFEIEVFMHRYKDAAR